EAFRSACAEELAAPKPGNVGVHAAGHGMTTDDFLRSAAAAAPHLCDPAAPLGQRILDAVGATRAAVGQNTNLGIVLLCAPPGGLGEAPRHDVRAPAAVPLRVAMAEAADRDRIAWQWISGFADIFGPGLTAYTEARTRWPDPQWAALAAYLLFLAAFPDSHIL